MNKFLKSIFPSLFVSENEIKRNTDKAINEKNPLKNPKFRLAKGETASIVVPDFGDQYGFKITEWYFKSGAIIKSGNAICHLENGHLEMELESIHDGRLIITCESKEALVTGMELCKIEGI